MKEEKITAIVLSSKPFRDKQKLVTLFSEELGLVSMIFKGLSPKKPSTNILTELLCEAEFSFVQGNSNLLKFQDGTILHLHLSLREKYAYLQAALEMTHAILRSQMPGKASPKLYALFSAFLKQIPSFPFLSTLLASFYLRLLKHEGGFNPLLPFSIQELKQDWKLVEALSECTNFQDLKKIETPEKVAQTIRNLIDKELCRE